MRALIFLCLVLVLVSCASQRTVLVNNQGEELTCETQGYGFFGSVSVNSQQEKCVSDAQQKGYRLK